MCHEMEQIYSEGIENGIERGIEQGEQKKAREAALSMAADGMKIEKIAYFLKVSAETVQRWVNEAR